MTQFQTELQTHFPQYVWQFNRPLAPLTYFKVGGPAEVYWETNQIEELPVIVRFCDEHTIPWRILGGASNVIVDDGHIPGLTIHLKNDQVVQLESVNQDTLRLQAGAGCKTALAVSQSINLGMTGLEYFLGVPGTLGGAIFNNAHYLSHLIGTYIEAVQVITRDYQLTWLPASECDFKYDHSRFQTSGEVITQVIFGLKAGNKDDSQSLIREATEYRARTQPLGEPSSGCIFQNTPNTPELQARFPQFAQQAFVPGGFLIDKAGLKGERVGDIEVSHKHAAFFINKGQGTAAQALALIEKVKNSVKQQFGVELQEEVFFLS